MNSTETNKPKFIVVSEVKKLVKSLGNQSGPEYLTALDASISASIRKHCADEGPNKRLNESSVFAQPKIETAQLKGDNRAKIKELRDEACVALLNVNVVTRKEYDRYFSTVRTLTEELLNDSK